jgi:hypothetical protein
MNVGEIVAVAELGDSVLFALANLLMHFAPHTVAYKVGAVVKQVAATGGNAIGVASQVIPQAPTPQDSNTQGAG